MLQQYSKSDNIAFAKAWAAETAKSGRKPDWIVSYEQFRSIFENSGKHPFLQVKSASRYLSLNREYANEYYSELARLEKKATKGKLPLAEKPFA